MAANKIAKKYGADSPSPAAPRFNNFKVEYYRFTDKQNDDKIKNTLSFQNMNKTKHKAIKDAILNVTAKTGITLGFFLQSTSRPQHRRPALVRSV